MSSCCWDSSVFIDWLAGRGANRTTEQLHHLRAAANDVTAENVILVTSSLIFVEVLPHKQSAAKHKQFTDALKRAEIMDVTPPIATIASQLRDQSGSDVNMTIMDTPDAIHLATALAFKCDTIFSYDSDILQFADCLRGRIDIREPTGSQLDLGV